MLCAINHDLALLILDCKGDTSSQVVTDLKQILGIARPYLPRYQVHNWTGRPTLTIRIENLPIEELAQVRNQLSHISQETTVQLREEPSEQTQYLVLLASNH